MSSLAKTDYPPLFQSADKYNKFKVKLNNIENKFPYSTIWKKKIECMNILFFNAMSSLEKII